MRVVHACVYDGDGDGAAPGRDVPCFGGVDVSVRDPAGLSGVVHAPQAEERRIVRDDIGAQDEVLLGVAHPIVPPQLLERLRNRFGLDLGRGSPDAPELLLLDRADLGKDIALLCMRDSLSEADQKFARHSVFRRLRCRLRRGRTGLCAAERERIHDCRHQDEKS
jgi:hypothetical protein